MHQALSARVRALILTGAASIFSPVVAADADADPGAGAALRDLIDAASHRLALADQVALSKWDSGKPVDDPAREKLVIDAAVSKARALGVSVERAADVFTDQVEANKFVQYRLLAQWRRVGAAPAAARPDLVLDIRPKLDGIQARLIDGLLHTGQLPARDDCARRVARAVGAYVDEKNMDPLHGMALDRAMARVCEK